MMVETPASMAPILYAVLCDTHGEPYLRTESVRSDLLYAMRHTDAAAHMLRAGRLQDAQTAWDTASSLTICAYVDALTIMADTLANGIATYGQWRATDTAWLRMAVLYITYTDTNGLAPCSHVVNQPNTPHTLTIPEMPMPSS